MSYLHLKHQRNCTHRKSVSCCDPKSDHIMSCWCNLFVSLPQKRIKKKIQDSAEHRFPTCDDTREKMEGVRHIPTKECPEWEFELESKRGIVENDCDTYLKSGQQHTYFESLNNEINFTDCSDTS
jgi:hypothetical protein